MDISLFESLSVISHLTHLLRLNDSFLQAGYCFNITAAWLAQLLVECWTAVRGSQGFKPQTGPTLRVLK